MDSKCLYSISQMGLGVGVDLLRAQEYYARAPSDPICLTLHERLLKTYPGRMSDAQHATLARIQVDIYSLLQIVSYLN